VAAPLLGLVGRIDLAFALVIAERLGKALQTPASRANADRDHRDSVTYGPPFTRPVAGDVIGFALRWPAQEHGVLWISGDTVLYRGGRQVAARLKVDTVLLHLGGMRFPVAGRYATR
jgi:hypothetical protein